MKQGTIVLTPFPFTDLSAIKRRPAVIISKVNELKDDLIVAFISSKAALPLSATDYLMESSHKDFNQTGLHKTSVFKMDKLVSVHRKIFTGELGYVSESILKELLNRLKLVFGI